MLGPILVTMIHYSLSLHYKMKFIILYEEVLQKKSQNVMRWCNLGYMVQMGKKHIF